LYLLRYLYWAIEPVIKEKRDSHNLLRQKAKSEGLKQLGSAAPDVYCIGVLYDDKTLKNANVKKDLMWFKCKSVSLSAPFVMLMPSTHK
jgi:hypothetical protein